MTGLPCSRRGLSLVPRTQRSVVLATVRCTAGAQNLQRHGSRFCGAALRAAPRPGHETSETYCSVGSSRSRSQSPITDTASVVTTMVAAGASMIQGARVRYSRP